MNIEARKVGEVSELTIKGDGFSCIMQRVGSTSRISTDGKIKSRRTIRAIVKELDRIVSK